MKSYQIMLRGVVFDTKAKNDTEAKRNAAYTYRARGKRWEMSIASLMKDATVCP